MYVFGKSESKLLVSKAMETLTTMSALVFDIHGVHCAVGGSDASDALRGGLNACTFFTGLHLKPNSSSPYTSFNHWRSRAQTTRIWRAS